MKLRNTLMSLCLLLPGLAISGTPTSKIVCAGDFPGWAPGKPGELHTDFYLDHETVTKSRIKLGAGYLILPVSVSPRGDFLSVSMGYLNGHFTYLLPLRLISGVITIADAPVSGMIDGRTFTATASCLRN
jgi:hypothetical protein